MSTAEEAEERSTEQARRSERIDEVAVVTPSEQEQGIQALRVIRHDFKTPLTSLKMLGQIFQLSLERGTLTEQPERTARNCKLLVEQVDKLVNLADNLYEVSLAQSGRLKLERQLADLKPVFQTVISRFESKINEISMPDTPIWGHWDTGRLLQAFSALMSEAEAVRLSVAYDEPEKVARITISGTFRQVGEKASPGRYLAGTIIHMHGGALENRFEITLPTAAPRA